MLRTKSKASKLVEQRLAEKFDGFWGVDHKIKVTRGEIDELSNKLDLLLEYLNLEVCQEKMCLKRRSNEDESAPHADRPFMGERE